MKKKIMKLPVARELMAAPSLTPCPLPEGEGDRLRINRLFSCFFVQTCPDKALKVVVTAACFFMSLSGIARAAEVEMNNGLVFLTEDAVNIEAFVQDKPRNFHISFRPREGEASMSLNVWWHHIHTVRNSPTGEVVTIARRISGEPDIMPDGGADDPAAWGNDPVPFAWRGNINGHYPDATVPQDFKVVWRRPLRSWGHTSPVLAGERIIVADHPFSLVCLDRRTGKVLWEREAPSNMLPLGLDAGLPKTDFVHKSYRLIGGTPITDGRLVHMRFLHMMVCYDIDGNLQWAQPVEYSTHSLRGGDVGSSMYLDNAVVTMAWKHFLAFDRVTGEPLWKIPELRGSNNKNSSNWTMIDGVEYALLPDGQMVDVAGTRVSTWPVIRSYGGTPVVQNGAMFLRHQPETSMMAYELLAGGEPVLRHQGGRGPEISPAAADGMVHVLTGNQLQSIDAATGTIVEDVSLSGGRIRSGYAHPVMVGDRIVRVREGFIDIIKPGPGAQLERSIPHTMQYRSNDKGGGTIPVFSGKRWYMRAQNALYCLASD